MLVGKKLVSVKEVSTERSKILMLMKRRSQAIHKEVLDQAGLRIKGAGKVQEKTDTLPAKAAEELYTNVHILLCLSLHHHAVPSL